MLSGDEFDGLGFNRWSGWTGLIAGDGSLTVGHPRSREKLDWIRPESPAKDTEECRVDSREGLKAAGIQVGSEDSDAILVCLRL